jgi:type III secretion protein W
MIGKLDVGDLVARNIQRTVSGAASQDKTGLLNGEQFFLADSASVLKKGMEELTQSLASLMRDQKKDLEARKLTADAAPNAPEQAEVESFLLSSGKFSDRAALAKLVSQLTSGEHSPRELLRKQDRDPAMQYALARYALLEGRKSGVSDAILDELEEVLDDLEMESGPQIRAGLNTMSVAAQAGSDPKEIQDFQDTYRDVVLGSEQSLAKALEVLLNRLGGTEGELFADGLENTIKALGADLSASRPSISKNRLEALVQDLYQLSVISTILTRCNVLANRMDLDYGIQDVEGFKLLKDLVSITNEKWVTGARFDSLAANLNIEEVDARIAFQMGNKTLLRDLPVKIFPTLEARQTVLDAVQRSLDDAIDLEDEGAS